MSISYKEARETLYRIRILKDTDYITDKQAESIIKDINEILKIITSIKKTSKKNL